MRFEQYMTEKINWVDNIEDIEGAVRPSAMILNNIPISKIKLPGTQIGKYQDKVDDIIRAMKKGEKFDPIYVEKKGNKYIVKDGHHRFVAAEELGEKKIPVIIDIE